MNAPTITKQRTRKGITYFAYNHQQGGVPKRGIGTLISGVYEKRANIYRAKNALSLSQSEYAAILEDGARVIRFDVAGDGKYSIDVDRFERFKMQHYDPAYGPQLMIELNYCQRGKPGERNPIIDNPPLQVGREYERPQPKQLDFFQSRSRFD